MLTVALTVMMPAPVLPLITLRAAVVVPPITAPLTLLSSWMPPTVLASAAVPAAFRPMRLPAIVGAASVTRTPVPVLPEITLPCPAEAPPTAMPLVPLMPDPQRIPPTAFGTAAAPVVSVPR